MLAFRSQDGFVFVLLPLFAQLSDGKYFSVARAKKVYGIFSPITIRVQARARIKSRKQNLLRDSRWSRSKCPRGALDEINPCAETRHSVSTNLINSHLSILLLSAIGGYRIRLVQCTWVLLHSVMHHGVRVHTNLLCGQGSCQKGYTKATEKATK